MADPAKTSFAQVERPYEEAALPQAAPAESGAAPAPETTDG
jgi:hypothetical protein